MEKKFLLAAFGCVLLWGFLGVAYSGPLCGKLTFADLREDEGYITYQSEPDSKQRERLKEEEKEKQERSWEMLRNMVIAPKRANPPAKTTVPPSR